MDEGEENYKNLGTLLSIAGTLSFVSSVLSGCNRRMLLASNFLIFVGVFLILGTQKFIKFFSSKKRIPGTILTVFGLLLIIIKKNVWGGLIQIVGVLILFGGFLPKLMNILQKIPYIGKYFRFALPSFFYQTNEELPY